MATVIPAAPVKAFPVVVAGMTGPTGPTNFDGAGPPGPIGPTGPTGRAGATGAAGSAGTDGAITSDAPFDGQCYGRADGAWMSMAPYEFDDAPADGNLYGRQNESWVEVSSAGAGPTGATGPQGAKGDTGLAGSPGIPGSAGATGPQGSIGSSGAAGATGPTGAQGSAGTPGTPGSAGATGPTGSVGASGGIGSTGATGPAGAGSPSNALPLMDGTATVGTSTNFAREGHIHPTDTSRAAVTYVDTQDALKVAKAGDTMTGSLTIRASPPQLILDRTGSPTASVNGMRNGLNRWVLNLGNDSFNTETGGNVGSDLIITRYTDAGATLDNPLYITRSSGVVNTPSGLRTGAFPFGGTSAALHVSFNGGGTQYGMAMRPAVDSTNAVYFFNAAGGSIGTISLSATATAYNTSSDDRLKTDLQEFDAGRIVDNTQVYSFAWKSTGERSYGVSAQQANEVYPEAVTYTEETDWWGIDYSRYVPVLLQELKALRARVAALEGGGLSGKPA